MGVAFRAVARNLYLGSVLDKLVIAVAGRAADSVGAARLDLAYAAIHGGLMIVMGLTADIADPHLVNLRPAAFLC
ncbi:hypothetical protein D3C77_453000 [compost metagenome]